MKIFDLKIKPNLLQPQSANPISQCQIENYKNFLCEFNNIRYGFYLELHMCTIIFFSEQIDGAENAYMEE